MPQITIIPSTGKPGELKPIVLSHPTPAQLADIVGALRGNGITYTINYGQSGSLGFSYPLAATFVSR